MTDERPPHARVIEGTPSPDDPAAGSLTDREPAGSEVERSVAPATTGQEVLAEPETSAAVISSLDDRPPPGKPREYRFPPFRRERLGNGLTVIAAQLTGRPLLVAQLVLEGGAGAEDPSQAGATSLMARALTEGTSERGAVEFIEASERLGAELHSEAGWETVATAVEVPRRRFRDALALLAEMTLSPSFPDREVERLREERLNDLLQARAEPRRRVERAFVETIYSPSSPFSRPIGGTEATVPGLDRATVIARHRAALDPASATLVVSGDLSGLDVTALAESVFSSWGREAQGSPRAALSDDAHQDGRRVLVVDRPGSPQTEVRVGHVGLARRIPDFHAVSVLTMILGGLFNSRLQRLLREERGYTYGINASFDFRRSAGPFSVRTAVQTEVTVAALRDILAELRRVREAPVAPEELAAARDYLIGVFPLRFEAPAQVLAAIVGLTVFGLPDDELDRYRPAVAAVSAEDVHAAASHIRAEDASVVLVGDVQRFEDELRAELGPVEVVRESPAELAVEGAEERPAAAI